MAPQSRLPVIAIIVGLLCLSLVVLLSIAGYIATPGGEPIVMLSIAGLLAATSIVTTRALHSKFRRLHGRRSILGTIAVALSYSALVVAVGGFAFPKARFAFAAWRTPPNYELTLDLQGSDEHPVTSAMLDQFKERLSLRLTRLLMPHEFLESQPPRIIVRLRVPEGSDMSRPFDSQILTINLVHDESEGLLKGSTAAALPEGWRVAARGALRLIVNTEALVVNDVHDATVIPQGRRFGVVAEFGSRSADRLRQVMRDFSGKRVAVLVNNEPYIAPRFAGEPPSGNEFLIASDLELAEANELALVLRSGMVPVPLSVIEGHYLK